MTTVLVVVAVAIALGVLSFVTDLLFLDTDAPIADVLWKSIRRAAILFVALLAYAIFDNWRRSRESRVAGR
jgi:peptidoglycan/LPS O-acetylase OafA/YrhL